MTYKYERPKGNLHKVSIKKWNRVFANRGKWPFVVANVYLQDDTAIVHHNISVFGKIIIWALTPLHFMINPFLYGFHEALISFKDLVFEKERGSFSSDYFYRVRNNKECAQWERLMKLIGKE